jgi:hypothetical protein
VDPANTCRTLHDFGNSPAEGVFWPGDSYGWHVGLLDNRYMCAYNVGIWRMSSEASNRRCCWRLFGWARKRTAEPF